MSHPGLESSLTGFFAAFLSAAAKADAHWYSMKSLSEGVPSLAGLLGVSSNNLDMILSLCGFAWLQKGGELVFLADKFKNFLVMSETEAFCEHTVFKLQGFSKSQHFIRVGAVNMLNMSKPGTKGLGPRIHNVRSLQTKISSIQFLPNQHYLMEEESHHKNSLQATLLLQRVWPKPQSNVSLILQL
jgi:hypothetical protein